MAFSKKQQIRSIRVLLTVFYGFLLSTILFHYIIHGIFQLIQRPTNPYVITIVVLGGLILISIGFAIYATWFDNAMIMLISGIVLICVFVLTLVFGIIRIINTVPCHGATRKTASNIVMDLDELSNEAKAPSADKCTNTSDIVAKNFTKLVIELIAILFSIPEETTKLIIELIAILFAIPAMFILYRYVNAEYAPVPTRSPKAV
ncbi:unnamed protein product [Rotaria sordida]|uniref:Uncharacterized protein n=1 Tax=Rotaria sordida TaxID=392033 RepID=A0A819U884_9BILA|nr:unnamed protein product [Rotaria sordida]CAF4099107.1 unnamed protein product [Rotaria sordida]